MTESKPVPTARDPQATKIILFAVAALLLLGALDQTIVSTALPTIVSELGGIDHLTWVVTAYLLTSTIVAPFYGKLGDLFGRKRMMEIAVLLFLAGSIACGFADTMLFLIVARALQGLGGGGLFVLAITVIGDVIPPRERGKVQGIFGGVFGLASVAGPFLGGFFVEQLSWRWIFFINLPIGLVALVLFNKAFDAKGIRRQHKIDYAGALLLTIALGAAVLLTTFGGREFAWRSLAALWLGGAAILGFIGFLFVEKRAEEPILPLSLFRVNNFAIFSAIGFITGAAMFGAITFLPIYLQVARGISPLDSGIQMLPLMLGVLVGSISSGRIMAKTGRYKSLPIIGSTILALAMFAFAQLSANESSWLLMLNMFIAGIGLGPSMSVGTTAIQNAIPFAQMGVGTAGFTMIRQIGSSIGVAIFGALFSLELAKNDAKMPTNTIALDEIGPGMMASVPEDMRFTVAEIFSQAMHPIFFISGLLAILAIFLATRIEELPLRARQTQGVAEG